VQENLLHYPQDEIALERLELIQIKLLPADDPDRIELSERRLSAALQSARVKNTLLAYHNFRRAVRLAPQSSKVRLEFAKFLSSEGAYTEAIVQLQRVEELTRSQQEHLIASDLMEVITRRALIEMERVNGVSFNEVWDLPTSELATMVGDPELIEKRIRWSISQVPKPKLVVAILPLKEVTAPFHSGIGEIMAEWIKGGLELFPGIDVIPISVLKNSMTSKDIDLSVLGKKLKADLVLSGKIIEGQTKLNIEIKAINPMTSKVLYSANVTTAGEISKMVMEISDELISSLSLNGTVLRKHHNSMITINLGRIHGIKEGDTVEIIKPQREILTKGFDWDGSQDRIISEGVVKGLTERYSEIEVYGDWTSINAGDTVRRKRKI